MKIRGDNVSDYIITPNGMVPVSDDVLMHWKYIKRVKKNGKWKYYYDEESLKRDLGVTSLNNGVKMQIAYDEATSKADLARKKSHEIIKENPGEVNIPGREAHNEFNNQRLEYDTQTKTANFYATMIPKYKEEYLNTPIGKIDKELSKYRKDGKTWFDRNVRSRKIIK